MMFCEIDSLKVGDKVGFARFHWGTMLTGGITTITKINGHRHITLANGRVFDKRGEERNAVGCGAHLYTGEYIQSCIADELNRRELNDNYTLLLKMLKDRTTMAGNFVGLDVFQKDDIIALIKRL